MLKLIKNTGKPANSLLFLSLLTIFIINILCNETTEIFPYGYELSLVTSSIAMSYVAGYIFYIASTLKINNDRIKNAKPISENIVKEVSSITENFLNLVCDCTVKSARDIETSLENKFFNSDISGIANIIITSNNQVTPQTIKINQAIYSELIDKINTLSTNTSSFYPILTPDIQIKLFEYLNCNFFQVFNTNNKSIMTISNTELKAFHSVFSSLFVAKNALVNEYEKYYGKIN